MSEPLGELREPVILGMPESEHPLSDPGADDFTLESAFSPQAGEEIPPADILAGVFRGRNEAGLILPDDVEEVRVLADSIAALSGRASPRMLTQLNIYAYALEKKEDELDPPLRRYLRQFKEETAVFLDEPEDFNSRMDAIFGESAERSKPGAEEYGRLGEAFADEPTTLVLFNLFVSTARRHGLIRRDWERDRLHLIYPPLRKLLHEKEDGPADWFVDVIGSTEEVLGSHLAQAPDNVGLAADHEGARNRVYAAAEGLAWTPFFGTDESRTDMHGYDYAGLNDLIESMRTRLDQSEHKVMFAKFALDISRLASIRAVEQKTIRFIGDGLLSFDNDYAVPLLRAAFSPKDGQMTTHEEFRTTVREHLGREVDARTLHLGNSVPRAA